MTSMEIACDKSPKPLRKRWTARGMAGFVLYTVGVFYMVIPIMLLTPIYPAIILHPFVADDAQYKELDKTVGSKREDFTFANSSHDQLNGSLWRAPGAKKVIIYHHGNAGNIGSRGATCKVMLASGADVFIYDYRGFGKSTGVATLQGILDDGTAAYDFVRDRLHYKPTDIINYGESLGGGVACHVAQQRPSGGLILQSAIASLPIVGRDKFVFLKPYPDFLFPSPHMDNAQCIRSLHIPITIIHGKQDATISYWQAEMMYANANGPDKHLVPLEKSGHMSINTENDLFRYLDGIKQTVQDSSSAFGA